MKTLLERQLASIDELLVCEYDDPEPWDEEPLDSLISAILSQNTNNKNSGAAYDAMRAAFPTWEAVMTAPEADLENALRPGGLAKTKAQRIQAMLRALAGRGKLSLDHLGTLDAKTAERELLSFKGVGGKTARCVLLFALHKDVFPIDTHIERILKRLGIVPEQASAEQAYALVAPAIPRGRCLALHLNLIAHGRQVCHARNPECARCVLARRCAYRRVPACCHRTP